MSPGLRTVLYTIVVLGLLLGYLPWQILRLDAAVGASLQAFLSYLGVLIFVVGAALLFSGAYYLLLRGDGTPLPFDQPKRLVVAGPYSSIQHPMMLGLLLMAYAEALWFYSASLIIYAALLTFLADVYLAYIEEPRLERRFGDDYRAYRAAVPRWWPLRRRKQQLVESS
ncbi:MAG: isoprenylcysteine carboxylmethyltransferase family protein [Candidatus Binatia bacterium]